MPRIALVFFDAGGGHRATALALQEAIRMQHDSWAVELVNLDDVLEPVDVARWFTGVRGSEWYNWWLRSGWTYGSGLFIPIGHAINRMLAPLQARLLRAHWRCICPDLVLSVVPHLNRVLYESVRRESKETPFVTLLTDFEDYPPHFWIESQRQHYICGTDRAVEQACSVRPASYVWQVSGMVIHPRFYQLRSSSRSTERRRLGLQAHMPTAIVLFGAHGSRQMLQVARRLGGCGVQAVFLCGRNRRLASRLRALRLRYPHYIETFTDRIPEYMALGDFLIGKAGPGSVSEGLHMGLPVIVESNMRTLAHERYNIEWLRSREVGIAIRSFRELPNAVGRLLDSETQGLVEQRLSLMNNQAVFEVVEIVRSILGRQSTVPKALAASAHQ